MIVGVHGLDANESSDAASATNTLVGESSEQQKTPSHLFPLIYASLLLSTLAFTFSIMNSFKYFYTVPNGVVGTILPFVFTLPHHGATFLLKWLQRHDKASIFPFAPASPKAIAYSALLAGGWVASTTLCAMSLRSASANPLGYTCFNIDGNSRKCQELKDYWQALAATLTSAVELLLILGITLVCYLDYRRQNNATLSRVPPPTAASVPSESKFLSV